MNVEDRLRSALHADDDVRRPTDTDAWARIQTEVRRRRAQRPRRAAAVAVAALVAVAFGVGSQLLDDGGEQPVDLVPADSTSTSPPTTAAVPESDPAFDGIWPFTSDDEVDAYRADPGIGMFLDPEATALEFAREYLGMPEPVSTSGFLASEDGSSGGVAITAKPDRPMITRIELRRAGEAGAPWVVVGADTDDIRVDRPTRGATVGETILVEGTSTAFEATVQVEVRQDDGTVLGETFVMGGANGEMASFAGHVNSNPPTNAAGAVIFTTESAEDGSIQEATVVRVAFGEAELTGGIARYSVFFHRGEELVEVAREGPETTGVLRQALESLFAGPQPETDGEGLSSWFSADTVDLLAGVNLRADGTAVVDLASTEGIEGANSATGGRLLLESINATVFQFSTVERIEYRLQGSCEAFWEWQQAGPVCEPVER